MSARGHRRGFPLALAGLGLVAALAVLAPVIAPFAPDAIDLAHRRAAPGLAHWFGTDELGRDVFTRILYGARVSLTVGALSALVTAAVGVSIGAVSGYGRPWLDGALMRFTDAVLAVPRLPLLMIAAAILDPSVLGLCLLVGLAGWMETARVVRSEVLSLKAHGFVEAAKATGAGHLRILARQLLPNVLPTIVVAATIAIGRGILLESALSFFGVGVQPPRASWGNMLYQAQTTMSTEPWVAIFPGALIFLTVLAVNFVGEGLARHPGTR